MNRGPPAQLKNLLCASGIGGAFSVPAGVPPYLSFPSRWLFTHIIRGLFPLRAFGITGLG